MALPPLLVQSAAPDRARAAGGRVVGIELNEPPGGDHYLALLQVRELGVGAAPLTLPWSWLKPDAGQLDVSFLAFGLSFYRAQGLEVLLSIPVIDTLEPLLPADLDAPV